MSRIFVRLTFEDGSEEQCQKQSWCWVGIAYWTWAYFVGVQRTHRGQWNCTGQGNRRGWEIHKSQRTTQNDFLDHSIWIWGLQGPHLSRNRRTHRIQWNLMKFHDPDLHYSCFCQNSNLPNSHQNHPLSSAYSILVSPYLCQHSSASLQQTTYKSSSNLILDMLLEVQHVMICFKI